MSEVVIVAVSVRGVVEVVETDDGVIVERATGLAVDLREVVLVGVERAVVSAA